MLGSGYGQSGEVRLFKGLPPTPDYVPGTVIAPTRDAAAAEPVPEKADGRDKSADRLLQPEREATSEPAADPVPAVESARAIAAAPPLAADASDAIWGQLVPLLPAPGNFAVIPGSGLRPHLVRKDEFDFCEEIKCYRSAAVLGAWNGGAFDPVRGEFRVHGGGHADYGGNEVYAFDFATLSWTRETDPQPLTGGFLRDADGDGEGDICPAPASGPPATHTYHGFIYVPMIDRYWLFGTGEYCADGMGGRSAWEYDANSGTWIAMPELDRYTAYARAVIDPRSGNVIVRRGGGKDAWHEIEPELHEVVRSFKDPFGYYIDGPAIFDRRRGVIYAVIGGRRTDRLVAYDWPAPDEAGGFTGRLIAKWPGEAKKLWGLAQHASGLLVLWDGNARIVTVDPETGATAELEPGGPTARLTSESGKPRKVYSKWVYAPAVDAFIGITDADTGIVLYRLGSLGSDLGAIPRENEVTDVRADSDMVAVQAAASAPLRQPRALAAVSETTGGREASALRDGDVVIPLEIAKSADWREVCATAVLCDPMGEGEVLYRGAVVESGPPQRKRGWRGIRQKFEHPEAKEAVADPEIGGLRFAFPSRSGSGVAGMFKTNFSPDYSFQVGPAEAGAPAQEVFIQFQVRYSCTFIWTDCDPSSPTYRTERRCFRSQDRDGGCTSSKIALIATGDREGETANACTLIQTAINHGADHYLTGFHRCPRTRGFAGRLPKIGGRVNFDAQPNGRYHCPRIPGDGSGIRQWNNSADTCFRLTDEKWITIQVRLRFGPWQKKPGKGEPKLSHISIWAAIEGDTGGRQLLVIDNDFYAMDPGDPRDFVGKIWLMPHLYRKSPKEDHPPFYVWYRNLVIAESLIPNPS